MSEPARGRARARTGRIQPGHCSISLNTSSQLFIAVCVIAGRPTTYYIVRASLYIAAPSPSSQTLRTTPSSSTGPAPTRLIAQRGSAPARRLVSAHLNQARSPDCR